MQQSQDSNPGLNNGLECGWGGRKGGSVCSPEGPLYFLRRSARAGICQTHVVGEKCAYFRPWIEHRPYMTHQGGIWGGSKVLRISKEAGGSPAQGKQDPQGPTDMHESPGGGLHWAVCPGRLSCGYPSSHVSRHSLWKKAAVGTPWHSTVFCAAPNSPLASCQPSGIRYIGFLEKSP